VLAAGAVGPLLLALAFWGGRGAEADPVLRGAMLARDAANLWLGGTLARAGRIATVFDPDAYWAAARSLFGQRLILHTWSYPPPMLLLGVPLSLLPLLPALAAWNATGAVLLWLGARASGLDRAACLVAATSPAALECALAGQNGLLCAALALPGFVLAERRPWPAGALLGALVLKPQLGVLVPVCLVASRNWPALAAAALSAAALALASALAFGWKSWTGLVFQVMPFMRHEILEAPWFHGPYQSMAATPFTAARWAGASLGTAYAVQAASAACAVVLCWRVWRAPGDDALARAAFTLALTFLATPYGYCYDLPALAAALAGLAARGRWPWAGRRALFAAAWIVPGWGTWLGVGEMPPLGLAAVLCAAALAWRSRPAEGTARHRDEDYPAASAGQRAVAP
jgi:hypothetical protein